MAQVVNSQELSRQRQCASQGSRETCVYVGGAKGDLRKERETFVIIYLYTPVSVKQSHVRCKVIAPRIHDQSE